MPEMLKQFEYVGPAGVREHALRARPGVAVDSRDTLSSWLREAESEVAGENGWATYVVDLEGRLVVAPRRTEHVACARGRAVLAAGEIRFDSRGSVLEITNNSTGYCPAEACWESVRAALDCAALVHPPAFTFLAKFRRCPACGERNLVKEEWYHCAMCDADLPAEWNF